MASRGSALQQSETLFVVPLPPRLFSAMYVTLDDAPEAETTQRRRSVRFEPGRLLITLAALLLLWLVLNLFHLMPSPPAGSTKVSVTGMSRISLPTVSLVLAVLRCGSPSLLPLNAAVKRRRSCLAVATPTGFSAATSAVALNPFTMRGEVYDCSAFSNMTVALTGHAGWIQPTRSYAIGSKESTACSLDKLTAPSIDGIPVTGLMLRTATTLPSLPTANDFAKSGSVAAVNLFPGVSFRSFTCSYGLAGATVGKCTAVIASRSQSNGVTQVPCHYCLSIPGSCSEWRTAWCKLRAQAHSQHGASMGPSVVFDHSYGGSSGCGCRRELPHCCLLHP